MVKSKVLWSQIERHHCTHACSDLQKPSPDQEGGSCHMLETTVVEMLQYVPVEDQVREPTD